MIVPSNLPVLYLYQVVVVSLGCSKVSMFAGISREVPISVGDHWISAVLS